MEKIATASFVIGKVFVVGIDGVTRALQVGDPVGTGETLHTAAGAHVELRMTDGQILALPPEQSVYMDESLARTEATPTASEAALEASTPETVLLALEHGANLMPAFEAPAAVGAVSAAEGGEGGEGQGSSFVRLLRIVEGVESLSYGYTLEPPATTEEAPLGGAPLAAAVIEDTQPSVDPISAGAFPSDRLTVEEESVPGLGGNDEPGNGSYTQTRAVDWPGGAGGMLQSIGVGNLPSESIPAGGAVTIFFDQNGQPMDETAPAQARAVQLEVRSDGGYTLTALTALHHDAGQGENDLALSPVVLNGIAGNGVATTVSLTLLVRDDMPQALLRDPSTWGEDELAPAALWLDESPLDDPATPAFEGDGVRSVTGRDFSVYFASGTPGRPGNAVHYGADGQGSVEYSLGLTQMAAGAAVEADGVPSGLYALDSTDLQPAGIDGDGIGQGRALLLFRNAAGEIEGRTDALGPDWYFRVGVNEHTGIVTFERNPGQNLWHPAAGEHDDAQYLSLLAAGEATARHALVLIQTVSDGDGDTSSAALSLAGAGTLLSPRMFGIQDDGPTADAATLASPGSPLVGVLLDGSGVASTGTDGGLIQSITVGGATYDYLGAASGGSGVWDAAQKIWEIVTPQGGTLVIDLDGSPGVAFDHGAYRYTPPAAIPPGGLSETFGYTVMDGDADSASSTLTVVIDPAQAAITVRDDHVIANGIDPVEIPHWALLANDSGASIQTVQGVSDPTGLTLDAQAAAVRVHDAGLDGGSFGYTHSAHPGEQARVYLTQAPGGDEMSGSFLDDILIDDDASHVLRGRDGDDILIGNGGADSLHGDNGADTLVGGQGDDSLTGGAGADVFKWSLADQGPATDHITDFTLTGAGQDILDLRDLLSGEHGGSGPSFNLNQYLHFETAGAALALRVDHAGGSSFAAGPTIVFDNFADRQALATALGAANDDLAILHKLIDNGNLKTDL